MRKETTLKGRLGDLQTLLSSLTTNSAELAHLEPTRVRFAELLAKALEAADRQGVHKAAKQQASLDLQTFVRECERLANILRLGVKQHYGIRAEKLAEFGLQPFRGRKTTDDQEPEPSPPVELNPPAPTSDND